MKAKKNNVINFPVPKGTHLVALDPHEVAWQRTGQLGHADVLEDFVYEGVQVYVGDVVIFREIGGREMPIGVCRQGGTDMERIYEWRANRTAAIPASRRPRAKKQA